MHKRKVIAFFVLLLMFASFLALLQILFYGKLGAFVLISTSNLNPDSVDKSSSSNTAAFGLLILLFVFIAALVLRSLERHRQRTEREHHSESRPFKRKLIPVN